MTLIGASKQRGKEGAVHASKGRPVGGDIF